MPAGLLCGLPVQETKCVRLSSSFSGSQGRQWMSVEATVLPFPQGHGAHHYPAHMSAQLQDQLSSFPPTPLMPTHTHTLLPCSLLLFSVFCSGCPLSSPLAASPTRRPTETRALWGILAQHHSRGSRVKPGIPETSLCFITHGDEPLSRAGRRHGGGHISEVCDKGISHWTSGRTASPSLGPALRTEVIPLNQD